MTFDHVWMWTKKPMSFDGEFRSMDRKGQACRVTARGAMNSVCVEFPDGFRVITSRFAVRKAGSKAQIEMFR